MKRLDILDSTLRDGAQSEGISFSLDDKLNIVRALDGLGVSHIEAGNPFSNPKDYEFFERASVLNLKNAKLVAFGSTRKKGASVGEDKNCIALLSAGTPAVSLVGKAWDKQVTQVLGAGREENLRMIGETVAFFKRAHKEVIFDAEHFFDGYKQNPSYAMAAIQAACEAGADCVALCDTNGGCFPEEIARMTRAAVEALRCPVGIHCHNDMGCAVANTLLAVEAGAAQIQGTFTGIGERCGNTRLSTVIPSLQLKRGYGCILPGQMGSLTKTARYIAEVSNMALGKFLPYVGKNAFAHKAGMHVDGVSKLEGAFEHIDPARVGNKRNFLISEVSGKAAVAAELKKFAPELTKESPETGRVMGKLKELEYRGFQFESATASLELLVKRELGMFTPFFKVEHFKIIGEQILEEEGYSSSALIKVSVGEQSEVSGAEGDGPVNALDRALRKALEVFYPCLADMRLIDYKVRVMEPKNATAAVVRVLIESTDGENVWTTVGASKDIINASFLALTDSVEYKLMLAQGTGKTV